MTDQELELAMAQNAAVNMACILHGIFESLEIEPMANYDAYTVKGKMTAEFYVMGKDHAEAWRNEKAPRVSFEDIDRWRKMKKGGPSGR